MTPLELYDLFRSDVVDVEDPPLWSEDEVWGYMSDAYRRFVRRMGGISDSTSPMTQIEVSAEDEWIDIDPRIIKIRHAQKSTNDTELTLINFEDTETISRGDDYGHRRVMRLTQEQGPLEYLVEGMEPHRVRCVPIPITDETVSLIVYRYPLEAVSADNCESYEFEIEEQHHMGLLDGMKAKAYSKQDAETFDRAKADEFEAKFQAYCENAKHERELSEHKYRSVAYGGI